jgi:hypothetical protein
MKEEIRISCKDLGAMALEDFCPRCFWIKRKAKQLPWQIFPGIFSSIDAYTKKVVHTYIDEYKGPPPWFPGYLNINGYMKAPHWSKFKFTDPVTGITISGVVDDILTCIDSKHVIPDYKTAKYTANQDKLLPMYQVQLNGYTIIHENMGHKVVRTPLIYCEPVTDEKACRDNEIYHADGFDMGFSVKVLDIERDPEMVFGLLAKAKDILEGPIPDSVEGCRDCANLANIQALMAA